MISFPSKVRVLFHWRISQFDSDFMKTHPDTPIPMWVSYAQPLVRLDNIATRRNTVSIRKVECLAALSISCLRKCEKLFYPGMVPYCPMLLTKKSLYRLPVFINHGPYSWIPCPALFFRQADDPESHLLFPHQPSCWRNCELLRARRIAWICRRKLAYFI